ncbi:hypothetical protein UB45_18460 [Terrabacter sp. 28]|nr:hypothetical protein UB45_18460 [Terrabacter sp. 28]
MPSVVILEQASHAGLGLGNSQFSQELIDIKDVLHGGCLFQPMLDNARGKCSYYTTEIVNHCVVPVHVADG